MSRADDLRSRALRVFDSALARHSDPGWLERACAQHPELANELLALGADQERAAHALAAMVRDDLPPPADAGTLGPTPTLPVGAEGGADLEHMLRRLTGRRTDRYRVRGEVGRGGMGLVLQVWDHDLRRSLAMKVMRGKTLASAADERTLRFLDEAQVTAQLDHPGVVPVHEVGLDAGGELFFTMKLVRGRHFGEVIADARAGRDGWTPARAVRALLRVCEALAYAHSKGVVHRDLKPHNVMVGRFGEVYVMDWGLAKVVARDESAAAQANVPLPSVELRSLRRDLAAATPESPLLTAEGDVVGTPAYMAPEQACGETTVVGPAADVYAAGTILYELLVGHAPYLEGSGPVDQHAVLHRVRREAPVPVSVCAPSAPPELAAICAKAMARDLAQRYPDMEGMRADLEAWLEGRVVAAYERGALAELRKWMARNPVAAAFLGALVVALLALAVFIGRAATVAAKLERVSELKDVLEVVQRAEVELDAREREAAALLPIHPDRVPELIAWQGKADALVRMREPLDQARSLLGSRIANMDASVQAALRDKTAAVNDRLQRFASSSGLSADIQARLDLARVLRQRSIIEHLDLWQRARRAVRAADGVLASKLYVPGRIDLTPQMGLVPIGMNPVTKLWEFYHLPSAADHTQVLTFRDDGGVDVGDGTGIVFVLLPGGEVTFGAQSDDPAGPFFAPDAHANEMPLQHVELAPFFIARHEMTVGQWARLFLGDRPSFYKKVIHDEPGYGLVTDSHPVEYVTYFDCVKVLGRHGLVLPTEAQWEYACRAGTSTRFWTGMAAESLAGAANLYDLSAKDEELESTSGMVAFEDGWVLHAPVATMARANPFGLFDAHGNVCEWCRDPHNFYSPKHSSLRSGDGYRESSEKDHFAVRGGSFQQGEVLARSSARMHSPPTTRGGMLGLRAVRPFEP